MDACLFIPIRAPGCLDAWMPDLLPTNPPEPALSRRVADRAAGPDSIFLPEQRQGGLPDV
jgi:hypothetical protein